MKLDSDAFALLLFLGVGLAMAFGGSHLLFNLPDGDPRRAVGLALLIVGGVILVIWRWMRRKPFS